MTDTVSLTIKIDPNLKEALKTLALENQLSLSQEVSQRLQASLTTQPHPVVDNQHTQETEDQEEDEALQLTSSELKQIRTLLKKSKKKK
ncbi:hypothetical protein COO59_16090 [Mixta theicola]|uniref:Arc-like DNA binding domain-containing protein n=1 Tax=Mixta theicola TaxID=1458355 RepID=A0A2K1Q6G8_9GAMM|nr:hypothetical protein [Mixta theicola]PNS10640.1 hypothetical protein COO59_16090 [Mixta theicola]GLR10977.1 hypothetical protein GCM10007905_36970 [Mixta theicola]